MSSGNQPSAFFSGGEKRLLRLEFDESEDIMSSLEKALAEHSIRECTVVGCNGVVREGLMNFFRKGYYRIKQLKETPVFCASGKFLRTSDGLKGDLHILSKSGARPENGTLVKGRAAGGFRLSLEFIDLSGSAVC